MANEVVKKKIDVFAAVQNRIDKMVNKKDIVIPKNYNVANALISAKLKLNFTDNKNPKSIMDTCSPESIQNSIFDMVIQGLSPTKNQCYFVGFGGHCKLMRSYMGTVAVAKRFAGVKDVKAYAIFKGDKFKTKFNMQTGNIEIAEFEPEFSNIDVSQVVGAFCMVFGEDGLSHTEVMSYAQLEQAWKQGYAYKASGGTHQKFTEEMAKKTVISRALKMFVNTSDDVDDTIVESYNREFEDIQQAEVIEESDEVEEITFAPDIKEEKNEVEEEIVEAEIATEQPQQEQIDVGF